MKVYILYAKENWITDVLAKEWINYNKDYYTNDINEATIIWVLSNYIIKGIPKHILQQKTVITTIHHITPWKIDASKLKHFAYLNSVTNIFHSICSKTTETMKKYFNKPIKTFPFWHNENTWYQVNNKQTLRSKYNIDDCFLVGSFQRDTEGASIKNSTFLPKLEKGPDIFIECIKQLKPKHKNIKVLLTGLRRQYVQKELKKINVPYYYFEMCDFTTLNELYNCLDLYIVSSRVEGGPRAINECGLTKTPLLTTDVGIVSLICHPESIFKIDYPHTILSSTCNIDYNYNQCLKYTIKNYMKTFTHNLLND